MLQLFLTKNGVIRNNVFTRNLRKQMNKHDLLFYIINKIKFELY